MIENHIVILPKKFGGIHLSRLYYFYFTSAFFFMASLPFPQLWHLRLGFLTLNLFELSYVAIIILLILHTVQFGISRFSFPVVFAIYL
jgi:hypothetical protein